VIVTYFDDNEDRIVNGRHYQTRREEGSRYQEPAPHCNRCHATDVRWRQQGGKWVLFSLEPGKLHICPIPDEFEAVPE
jgi:hypothetical protein